MSGPTPPFRCAAAARKRDDPQLGSAPQARRWLLIEHRGPWQIDALAGSGIAPAMLQQINRAVHDQAARPLLIRRPGRTDATVPSAWAVCYEDGAVRWGGWSDDTGLESALQTLAAPSPGPGGDPEPILLACTHGLHDVCCALRGRPVAAALAQEWPEATWECSHVGGDRFAANLVVLPDGVYYGNLDPETAVHAVRSHLAGAVAVQHLRGMTRVSPPAQVAVAAVHERLGPFGAGDVRETAVTHTSPGVWRVQLAVPKAGLAPIEVTVASARRAPAQLTCRAASDTPAAEYRVVNLVVG